MNVFKISQTSNLKPQTSNFKFSYLIKFLFCVFLLSNSVIAQVKGTEIISKTKEGIPKIIRFSETKISSDKNAVASFLKEQFKADSKIEFKASKIKGKVKNGFVSQKYDQYYNGLKVEFARVNAVSQEGSLHFVNGAFIDVKDLNTTPSINKNTAIEYAKNHIGAEKYMWENEQREKFIKELKNNPKSTYFPDPELVIIREDVLDELSNPALAYKIKICAEKPYSKHDVYVNATTGKVIYKSSLLSHVEGTAETRYSGTRTIETEQVGSQFRLRDYSRGDGIETFNMNNGTTYGSATDYIDNNNNWTSGEYNNANKNNAALDAHWGVMMVYDYFLQEHNLDSYDGNGSVLKSYVHFSSNYENAFWDLNDEIMTYGDGNLVFDALTSLDVVGHEIAHGIDQFSSDLEYENESGSIDEGIADIWGAMVEMFAAPEKSIYLIGEDIMLLDPALRSMINPKTGGRDSQPDTYQGANWYTGSNQSILVHTNSGVMTHWFYLLAEGSSATDEINDNFDTFSFTGIGTEKAAKILFHAQQNYFTDPFMGYIAASNLIIQAAIDLYGIGSMEVNRTQHAWFAVGIGTDPSITVSHSITGPTQVTPGYQAFYTLNPYINATNYVWSIPSGCHFHYCWGIIQGQGTNTLRVEAGNIGTHQITCTIYNGGAVIGSQYITVNVQNPYGGGGGGNGDPCGGLQTINGVIYPPEPCNSNGFASTKPIFKSVQVYDLLGKKILDLKNQNSLDTNNFSSGLYILKMKMSNNEMITKKILK